MARDCQAEAEDLHPLPEGPGEKARGKHGRLSSVLTVSTAESNEPNISVGPTVLALINIINRVD